MIAVEIDSAAVGGHWTVDPFPDRETAEQFAANVTGDPTPRLSDEGYPPERDGARPLTDCVAAVVELVT